MAVITRKLLLRTGKILATEQAMVGDTEMNKLPSYSAGAHSQSGKRGMGDTEATLPSLTDAPSHIQEDRILTQPCYASPCKHP